MITQVSNTKILPQHQASCHCGAVVFELTLPNGIENPMHYAVKKAPS